MFKMCRWYTFRASFVRPNSSVTFDASLGGRTGTRECIVNINYFPCATSRAHLACFGSRLMLYHIFPLWEFLRLGPAMYWASYTRAYKSLQSLVDIPAHRVWNR